MSNTASKVYNFCAGPAQLPETVLQQAQQSIIDWQGTGTSILSIGHRTDAFMQMVAETEQDLRALMQMPDHYRVLFMQGGATSQFSALPLNLLHDKHYAEYIVTGHWGKKAVDLARQYGDIRVVAEGLDAAQNTQWPVSPDAAYVHCTPNETIDGVEFRQIEATHSKLVADLSSSILSQPIRVEDYAMIYAGAQKNIGPAGLCVVLIREDMIGQAAPHTPPLYNYETYAKQAIPNTPPTFAWYVCHLVFQWLKQQGGLSMIAERNTQKAQALYDFIDQSALYSNQVPVSCRSRMNVIFQLARPELEPIFLRDSKALGLVGLAGHRAVGGMRASLYNAMPLEGVQALIQFMQAFEEQYG